MKHFYETSKGLAKNPLGIIALFIVLIYGFASLVVGFSNKLQPEERFPIIWFLVLFPVLVLVIFSWLVSKHHEKLYAPKDYVNDKSFLHSVTNRNKLGTERDNTKAEIISKVKQVITSNEFIAKLKEPGSRVEAILEDIAKKTSNEVIKSSFVEINLSKFVGDIDSIFSFPISAFTTFDMLLDAIYFKIESKVGMFTYGYSWVLIDSATSAVIKNSGMITNTMKGVRVSDNRSLFEVGIHGGSNLIAVSPKTDCKNF